MRILQLITELLTAFISINTKYTRKNTNSIKIDIKNCTTCKKKTPEIE